MGPGNALSGLAACRGVAVLALSPLCRVEDATQGLVAQVSLKDIYDGPVRLM